MRAVLVALTLLFGTARPLPSQEPIAQVAQQALPADAAAFVAHAAVSLDGELALLDGGPLSAALLRAAREGRILRLLLDPAHHSTRLQGMALQSVSSTVQVRWKPKAGKLQRRLLADAGSLLTWSAGQEPVPTKELERLEKAKASFERQWSQALLELPEDQRLQDALQDLPDPREKDPHFIRRREAAGE